MDLWFSNTVQLSQCLFSGSHFKWLSVTWVLVVLAYWHVCCLSLPAISKKDPVTGLREASIVFHLKSETNTSKSREATVWFISGRRGCFAWNCYIVIFMVFPSLPSREMGRDHKMCLLKGLWFKGAKTGWNVVFVTSFQEGIGFGPGAHRNDLYVLRCFCSKALSRPRSVRPSQPRVASQNGGTLPLSFEGQGGEVGIGTVSILMIVRY